MQALQEDEDETLNVSNQHATQVGQMLGDENDNLFPAILKLVMADAVYCETYEPESGNVNSGGTVGFAGELFAKDEES